MCVVDAVGEELSSAVPGRHHEQENETEIGFQRFQIPSDYSGIHDSRRRFHEGKWNRRRFHLWCQIQRREFQAGS